MSPELAITGLEEEQIRDFLGKKVSEGHVSIVQRTEGGDTYIMDGEPVVLTWKLKPRGRQELLVTSKEVLDQLEKEGILKVVPISSGSNVI